MLPVLVDTSVWVRHFKHSDDTLCELLQAGRVVTHEFIIEELTLGGLADRDAHLHLLCLLQRYSKVTHQDVVEFIKTHARKKHFKVGLVDNYLLCAAVLHGLVLYTDDAGLAKAARALGVGLS